MAKKTKHAGVVDLGQGMFLVRVVVNDRVTGKRLDIRRKVEARTANDALRSRLALEEEFRRSEGRAPTGAPARPVDAPTPSACKTVGEVAREWFEAKKAAKRKDGTYRLAPTTRTKYEDQLEMIDPYLGEVRIDVLTRKEVEEWRDYLGGGYAASTTNGALGRLRQILGSIDVTVADRVASLPEDDTRITDEQPNRLEEEEVGRFLRELRVLYPQHLLITMVLLSTGARISTVLALEWPDIDPVAETITYRRRRSEDEVLEGVKRSRKAVDVAPLHPEVWAMLEEHRESMSARERASGLVFPSARGGYRSRSILAKPFEAVLKHAGIEKRFTPSQGSRRTAAQFFRKVAGKDVAKSILGHLTDEMHEHYSGGADSLTKGAAVRAAFKVFEGGAMPAKSGIESGIREEEEKTATRK